jgi:hydrogenase/urease accessory protein HupE
MNRICWLALCLSVLALDAQAHDPGLSRLAVQLREDKVEVALTLALADAGRIVDLDRDRDGEISNQELTEAAAAMQKIAGQAVEIKLDGQSVDPTDVRCGFHERDNATVELTFPAKPFKKFELRSKWLVRMPPGHRQFFSLQKINGTVEIERLLDLNSDSVVFEPAPSDLQPPPAVRVNSFADFLVMGVKHIWTGYDHLLFLFGLLIVTRNFSSSVKIITCFTIAHSITLAVATLSLVQISSRFVEPMIAASIVYVGIENLFRGDDPKGRWLLTFAFGLIHGFGFASVLRELGVGENGSGIAVPLVSFNLGVELGQIAIAAMVLPMIWKLRTRPQFVQQWVPICSVLVALLGSFWFVQRVWF